MRNIDQWLSEYGESHRNPVNKRLHWICVPVIVWCVIGLLWSIPVPAALRVALPLANFGVMVVAAALLYYAVLSPPLALGAAVALALMLWSVALVAKRGAAPLLSLSLGLFLIAWVVQFIGHAIEGRRPSFFKDLQFLLIGPLWLLADLFRRLGLRY